MMRTRSRVLAAHAVSIIPSARPVHVMLIFKQVLAQRVLVLAIVLTPRTVLWLALPALVVLVQNVCHQHNSFIPDVCADLCMYRFLHLREGCR